MKNFSLACVALAVLAFSAVNAEAGRRSGGNMMVCNVNAVAAAPQPAAKADLAVREAERVVSPVVEAKKAFVAVGRQTGVDLAKAKAAFRKPTPTSVPGAVEHLVSK